MNRTQSLFWKELVNESFNYQTKMDPLLRKQTGVYYTDLELTDKMVKKLFDTMSKEEKDKIYKKKFLEPCVGIGNFVFSYLKYIHENLNLNNKEIKELISNIYVCDIDINSMEIFLNKLEEFIDIFFNIKIPKSYFKKNIGNALVYDLESEDNILIEPETYFGINKFDIILTNPPYKMLRAEKKHYKDLNQYEKDKNYYNILKKDIQKKFLYQGKGVLNLYKLFLEKIIENYIDSGGYAYLLIPQTILKDQSSTEMRRFLIKDKDIVSILNIGENSKFIDAKQALSAIMIKNSRNEINEIEVIENFSTKQQVKLSIEKQQIIKNMNYSFVAVSKEDEMIFKKMNSFKKVGDYDFINNLRGELDLSINKKFITSEKTKFTLIRGRNLGQFSLKNIEIDEFVEDKFVKKSNKNKYINEKRIACQQISNLNSKKRLSFCMIPENFVLGNSCNFITIDYNTDGIDLYFLLGLLNSNLYNWYFGLFSSNNHINNYEIDNLPIIDMPLKKRVELSNIVKKGILGSLSNIQNEIDEFLEKIICSISKTEEKNTSIFNKIIVDVGLAFSKIDKETLKKYLNNELLIDDIGKIFNFTSFELSVFESIIIKYEMLEKQEVLNHTSFKLSDLDMEMVRSVRQGGNWKQIPLSIAEKSKRLMKIRETGGRTTLYGRLHYEKPSYTITTYFNRPGNGTNIHPIQDRVLSVREAARIQSFPDDFYFYGNKKDKLNQIGNAVPPLMAYQIAKKIKENISVDTSLDLFNGAGGMTTGFKLAGYKSVLMNDIDKSALITAKINNPEIYSFLGDITIEKNRDFIIEYSRSKAVDIVNGGPPCQGFSMAGFRKQDDPRSKLIYDYVKVIEGIMPKVFVFENVQGILSHNKGNTFKELLKMFDEIGYKIKAKLLDFSDFGIPQKRKRVIIIGVRNDISIDPENLFPIPFTESEDKKISVKQAIGDLENVPVDNNSYYIQNYKSNYLNVLQGKLEIDNYISNLENTTGSKKLRKIQLSLF